MADKNTQRSKKGNKHAVNSHRRDRKYLKVPTDPRTGRKIKYQEWKKRARQGVCGCPFCNGR